VYLFLLLKNAFENFKICLFQINFFMILDRLNVLMSKIKFLKNIILMYFQIKSYLKNNRYHNTKYYMLHVGGRRMRSQGSRSNHLVV